MLLTECYYAALAEAGHSVATREANAFRRLAAQSDDDQILQRLKGFLGNRKHAHLMANDLAARSAFEDRLLGEAGLFNPSDLPDLIKETLDNLANAPLGELADMLGDGGSNQ